MEGNRPSLAVVLTMLFILASFCTIMVVHDEASALVPRGSILIDGNGDFTPANGVIQGSGTVSDPYIIEGWEINLIMGNGTGIEIRNTDAYFVIHNVHVFYGSPTLDGIVLHNVSNGAIENAISSDNNHGIILSNSKKVAVTSSEVASNVGEGIYVSESENVSIDGNHALPENYYSIYLVNSTNVDVTANNMTNKRATLIATYCNGVSATSNRISSDGGGFGIHFDNSNDVVITGNNISNFHGGIHLFDSTNLSISNNHFSDVDIGIEVASSANVMIANHAMSGIGIGILLDSLTNVMISNNDLLDNRAGIIIYSSSHLSITGNVASFNSEVGVRVAFSTMASITGNTFVSNGIHLRGSATEHYNSHTITPDNLVNGLPIHYYKDCTNLVVDNILLGQLIIGNCTNVMATNLNTSNTDSGIQMGFVDNVTVVSTDASWNNIDGIEIAFSTDLTITGNTMTSNNNYGINLYQATESTISSNDICCSGSSSIYVMRGNNTTISFNNVFSNGGSIYVGYSNNSTVEWNEISDNHCGVNLGSSSNITVVNNNVTNSGDEGIFAYDTTNSTIDHNLISFSKNQGIYLLYSSYNTITRNIVFSSGETGIYLFSIVGTRPGNNTIFHNSIVNNTQQAFDNTHLNQWDDGYPSGGNYWSDYAGVDEKSGPNQDLPGIDGIGDTPYVIDADSKDRYPLMSPVEFRPIQPPTILRAVLSGPNLEDVTIRWALSSDDGMGFKSVIGYDVYRGNIYNAGGLGYSLIATLSNGTTEFVDDLAGKGDPNNYFYQICALDLDNQTACAMNQAGKYTRQLSQGPALVSIPLIQSDESVIAVLQTVEWDKAWGFDSSSQKWKWHMTFKPYKGSLEEINHTKGIWVNVTQDSNLTVAGVVPTSTTIDLQAGWNLVGFPSFDDNFTVADLKMAVAGERVEGFDALASPYFLRLMLDGDTLQTGFGYWVKAVGETTWTVVNS